MRTFLGLLTSTLLLAAAPAHAKPCDLDLQIVLLNPLTVDEVATPLAVADALTFGFASKLVHRPLEIAVVDVAASSIQQQLADAGVQGTVRRVPAVQSGRATGWFSWDPETGVTADSEHGSDALTGVDMLAIHVEDPEKAAATVGGRSPSVLALAKALGVDLRGRVYQAIFEAMRPSLTDRKLRVLVNTGLGLKCRDVAQTYE